MVFAIDSWYTYTIIIGARNQHTASDAYEFHIHRAYIIYGGSYQGSVYTRPVFNLVFISCGSCLQGNWTGNPVTTNQ